jgi:hypothetical protein
MKRVNILVTGLLGLGVIVGSVAVVNAYNTAPERPDWVTVDGRIDLSKMPDDARVPYQCWNGKTVSLKGKDIKQRQHSDAMPGSIEHDLGMAKVKELQQIPGAVTTDETGGLIINIDESNPEIVKLMKKYEVKENPECS